MILSPHKSRQALDPVDAAKQAVRMRTLRMTATSYLGMITLVVSIGYFGLVPTRVVFEYVFLVAVLLSATYLVFVSNWNLRLADPSFTMVQACAAFGPTLWVMYWSDGVAVRAALLVASTLPPLYAVLALHTRQLYCLATLFVGAYSGLLVVIWLDEPGQMDIAAELIMWVAIAMVMFQFAVVGGFISGLRQKLRNRNEEIRELANRDALTGLYNRRHLHVLLDDERARADRGQSDLSICIFDIDHFKQVNDVHGHQAGDQILSKVARTTMENLRSIDCCARYGGEEFALVLPQTPLEGAQKVAERLREEIAALEFPEISSGFRITISIGCADYTGDETMDEVIARADAALYLAKDEGRNRVKVKTK
jgi:diguanylate cyclase (GGDEF)-like protein